MTIFDRITDYANLEKAYQQTQKGERKFRADSIRFSFAARANLVRLWQDLRHGTYQVGPYIQFRVYSQGTLDKRLMYGTRLCSLLLHTVLKRDIPTSVHW